MIFIQDEVGESGERSYVLGGEGTGSQKKTREGTAGYREMCIGEIRGQEEEEE